MKNKKISQEVLNKIKDKNIKPKPKWKFLVREYLMWIFFGLAVFVGSLAVSIIIFILTHIGWSGHMFKLGFLLNIPYFWILILLIFLFLAYYNFKHTKNGYQYNPYMVVVLSVLISIVLGSVMYGLGQGEKMERMFYKGIPIYRQMIHKQFKEVDLNKMPHYKMMEINFERKIIE